MSRYALRAIGILLPEPGWVVCALRPRSDFRPPSQKRSAITRMTGRRSRLDVTVCFTSDRHSFTRARLGCLCAEATKRFPSSQPETFCDYKDDRTPLSIGCHGMLYERSAFFYQSQVGLSVR